MEQLLYEFPTLQAWVSDRFSGEMLAPIIENLLFKARHHWDDYDEVFHCCRLVQVVQRTPALHMAFHSLRQDGETVGVALITSGDIGSPLFFPRELLPRQPVDQAAVLNYFHISPRARGVGEAWLREVILPHCRQQGLRTVYVKSSHPRVFSLYARLGDTVGDYQSSSDNGLFSRPGRMFRLPLE